MTWSVLQSAGASFFGTAVTAAFGSNVASGSKIIAVAASSWSDAPSSAKDGAGNSLTLLGAKATTTGSVWLYAMDVPAGDVGTKPAITVTWPSSNGQSLVIQEVPGLLTGNTTAMLDGTPGVLSGTGTTTGSPSYASTAAGEYLVCAYGDGEGEVTPAAISGWTKDASSRSGTNADSDASVAYKSSTGGTETSGYTGAFTGGWALVTVAFKLAGGAPVSGTASLSAASALSAPAVQRASVTLSATSAVTAPGTQGAGASLAAASALTAPARQEAPAALSAVSGLTAGATQESAASLAAAAALTAGARQGAGASLTAGSTLTASAGGAVSGAPRWRRRRRSLPRQRWGQARRWRARAASLRAPSRKRGPLSPPRAR